MTVNELGNLIYSFDGQTSLVIFSDEDTWDEYHRTGLADPDVVVASGYQLKRILRPPYAKAEVTHIVPTGKDVLEVVVELYRDPMDPNDISENPPED